MSKKDLSYIETSARYNRNICSQAPLLKQGIYLSSKLCHFKGRNIIRIVNAWKDLPPDERHEYSIINSLEDQYNRSTKHNQQGDFTRGLPKKKSLPEISFKRTLSEVRPSVFSQKDEKFNEDSRLIDAFCNSSKSTIQSSKISQDRTHAYNLLAAQAPQNQSHYLLQRLNLVSKLAKNIESLSINIKSKRQRNVSLEFLRDRIIHSDNMKKHLLKLAKHATPSLNDAERIVPETPFEDIIHSLCDCSILNTNLPAYISTPEINHCLYISCAKVANDLSQLKKYSIHSILSINLSITKYSYIRGGYLDISLTSANLEKYREVLYKASRFIAIKLQEGNLLICCYSGFSNSCLVFISYLMFRHKFNLTRSVEILRTIRPNAKIDSKSNGELVKLETFMIKYAGMI